MAAYSSGSAIPIVGAVMGPLYAGLAGVASLIQINNIKKAKFDGGGSVSAPPFISMPTVPPNPYTNDGKSTDGLEGSGFESTSKYQSKHCGFRNKRHP